MLFRLWERNELFRFTVPNGFSSSILLTSPFLFFALRRGGAINVEIRGVDGDFHSHVSLWIHGNSGGWQFGYRYAMILLPWIF
jgi:hypothetical protein